VGQRKAFLALLIPGANSLVSINVAKLIISLLFKSLTQKFHHHHGMKMIVICDLDILVLADLNFLGPLLNGTIKEVGQGQ